VEKCINCINPPKAPWRSLSRKYTNVNNLGRDAARSTHDVNYKD